MKAALLIKNHADATKAFEWRDIEKPVIDAHEVLIKTEAFGLNFADVMARLGMYRDCPDLPAVVGYDVVGKVEETGADVTHLKVGDRVTAMTRFGGYAEYAKTDARAAAAIPEDMEAGAAAALTTQYCTAYYCAEEMVRLREDDFVLIHAVAGGVGTALVQLAKYRGCQIIGTAGSDEKLEYLKQQGVHYPINYRKDDFVVATRKVVGERGVDVIFDSIGGDYVKRGLKLLSAGGRFVGYGAAKMSGARNIFSKAKEGLAFGIYHPAQFYMNCRSLIGVNMLRIADHRPDILKRVLEQVVRLTAEGILQPQVGGVFNWQQLPEAHHFLESRQSMGKVVVKF